MKKIIFLFISVCFVFSYNINPASSSKIAVSKDGSALSSNNKLQRSYNDSRSDFQNSVQKYKESRKNFLEAKSRFQNKKDNMDRGELKKKSFDYLDKINAVMIKHLESFENRVENIKFISDDLKMEMVGRINENKNIINIEIEKIKSAKTIEEQRILIKELKLQWKNVQFSTKEITGQIISAKIDVFISKMKKEEEKFEIKVDEMKDGEKKNLLQEKVKKFDEKIKLSEFQKQLAQEKFLEINNTDQKNVLFKEGLEFIHNAHQYIKESHKELSGIAKEIREEKENDKQENQKDDNSIDEISDNTETEDNLSDEKDNDSESEENEKDDSDVEEINDDTETEDNLSDENDNDSESEENNIEKENENNIK